MENYINDLAIELELEKIGFKRDFVTVDDNTGEVVTHMSRRKGGSSICATIEDMEINGEDAAEWIEDIKIELS